MYRNTTKDASIAFCANCSTPVSLHIRPKAASKNYRLRSTDKSNTTFETEVICCNHIRVLFFAPTYEKRSPFPRGLILHIDIDMKNLASKMQLVGLNLVA